MSANEYSATVRRAARILASREAHKRTASPNLPVDILIGGKRQTVTLGSLNAVSDKKTGQGDMYQQMRDSGLLKDDGTLDTEVAEVMGLTEFVDA